MVSGVIDAFLVWWLRSDRCGWSKLRRRLLERRYLSMPLPEVRSVEDIAACLKQVTWTMDGPFHLYDSISYPQVTWAKKKDDCDGFSTLAAELLKKLDPRYSPRLVTAMLHPVRSSHTVCAFTNAQGGISFFDNDSLRDNCTTYREVVGRVAQGSERLVCWDMRKHDTLQLIEFHREPPPSTR